MKTALQTVWFAAIVAVAWIVGYASAAWGAIVDIFEDGWKE